MGITPDLTSGVWTGCEDRAAHFRTITLGQGANMALPIWALYMKQVYADSTLLITEEDEFIEPPGFELDLDCEAQKKSSEENLDNYGGSETIFY